MAEGADFGAALAAVNAASPFNKVAGFEIIEAQAGAVTLALAAGPELMNHAGALHAGVQAALLDTACGYAAGTLAGNVVTLQLNLQFLASAKGDRFEARARVTKAGKAQLFAAAELIAWRDGAEVLAASASAVLAKLG
ncbi:MAG TPA: PaaI family thioesterase [Allosphingosinicella sp.]|nr:PaaI family thioesterase [Allosphingosinicella sp.]